MNHIQCYSVRVSRHTAVTNLIVTRAVSAIAELLVTVASNAKIEWAYVPDANITDCLLQTTANRNVDDSERRQSLISSLFWPTTLVLGYVLQSVDRHCCLHSLHVILAADVTLWSNSLEQCWQTESNRPDIFDLKTMRRFSIGTPSRQDRQRRDEN